MKFDLLLDNLFSEFAWKPHPSELLSLAPLTVFFSFFFSKLYFFVTSFCLRVPAKGCLLFTVLRLHTPSSPNNVSFPFAFFVLF